MKNESANADGHAAVTLEEFQGALARLLQSRTLKNRARLREFLEYVGTSALEGHGAEIKEQAIGISVFGRPAGYAIHEDTIVRVTARQLRQKIDEYYRKEGADDPFVIEIAKGGYVPVCTRRSTEIAPVVSSTSGRTIRFRSNPTWAGWAVAAVLAGICVFLWVRAPELSRAGEPTLLSMMLPANGQRVAVVTGDGVVQVYKELTGDAPTVADYENRSYLQSQEIQQVVGTKNPVWEHLRDRQLLATGSLHVLVSLLQAIPKEQISVRHPKEVTIRDFYDTNAILLSGPFANPWVQIFEEQLNYRIDLDEEAYPYIRNANPRGDELSEYRIQRSAGKRTAYARLAYLPNLGGQGKTLLIGGPSEALMEIMGSAVSDPGFLRELAERFGASRVEDLPYCEILMEVSELAGAPVESKVLAVREVQHPAVISRAQGQPKASQVR